ncbi:MAG TPA: c-type cytochrome [Chitinophagaceae bacterium]|nr:c-type cytochrome [Chitinophagaceae bacterium]
MRRFKKILKWTGLILLFMIIALSITTAARQNLKYEAPYPDIKSSDDTAIISRGRHLVYSSAHCIDCHYKGKADSLIALSQEVPLSGGVVFDLPVGKIYSKNITADPETGIGRFTDAEIARALRYGVHPDGTAIFDFMAFHNTSDEDLRAIISYLRTQKPVANQVPQHSLNLLGKVVKAFMVKPAGPTGTPPMQVIPDTTAIYGQYLATGIAECNGCHTKRDISGAYTGEPFAGGNEMGKLITPNLTPDSSSRIFGWTKKIFINRFRMGTLNPDSHMPWTAFGRMTDDELTAIYNYLKTVKPVRTVIVNR